MPPAARRPRSAPAWLRAAFAEGRALAVPLALLLLLLFANRTLEKAQPTLWILVPLALAAALSRSRFEVAERPVVRLWQLVGCISALYALLHYPLLPMLRGDATTIALYATLLALWLLCLAAGVLCWRIPSLAILPPAFLLWADATAGRLTGLPTTVHIDVRPLTEVALCIGLGLAVQRLLHRDTRLAGLRAWHALRRSAAAEPRAGDDARRTAFAQLLLLLAIGVHLANYYWSFRAKLALGGPAFTWLTENNPASIFLVALDDGHVLFAGQARLVALTHAVLDAGRVPANATVLVLQAVTAVAFFLPRRALVVLLLLLDAMHLAIVVVVGANFWPWILLNVAVAVVVATHRAGRPSLAVRTIATAFVLLAPHVIQVAKLGWYDVPANNRIHLDAVDESGQRYTVPTNFFTFYSYSFGHMDYGSPDAAHAFTVGSPNGGTNDVEILRAGRRCDAQALMRRGDPRLFDAAALASFVGNYHRLALAIGDAIGVLPYDLYPHHFYMPPAMHDDFRQLDLHRVVAYVYRRESVCLSFGDGALQRRLVSAAELRIEVGGKGEDERPGR